jgi:hypothetical protein
MKILSNEKTIKRNIKVGQYTTLTALVILAAGMVTSFTMPEQFYLPFAALFVGFILSQIGIYFGNRWGRRPRTDERITAALKGMTHEYTLYHYLTPVSHLLVGPAGVWVIEPYHQRGTITYEKNQWKQKGGGFMLAYLKLFAQEGLGRPDLETQTDLESLRAALKKVLPEAELPTLNAVLVFYDPRADLQAENAPLPTLKIQNLKEHLRKAAKQNPLPTAQMQKILQALPQESVE